MLQDLSKAFECFQKVIAIEKNNFNCLVNIGNCYISWNQPDEAIVYYIKAAIANMKSIIPLKSLVGIYKRKQHLDSALIFVNQCLFLEPKHV